MFPSKRLFQFHKESTLHELHQIIQLSFYLWDHYPAKFTQLPQKLPGRSYYILHNGMKSPEINTREVKLKHVFFKLGDQIGYRYDHPKGVQMTIRLHQMMDIARFDAVYPICLEATGIARLDSILSPSQPRSEFPLSSDPSILVRQVNERISTYFNQYSRKQYDQLAQFNLYQFKYLMIDFYQFHPWERIKNDEIIVIYDELFQEYLFCSILGNHGEMKGLSIYIGKHGLQSLIATMVNGLSYRHLFHLSHNIIIEFKKIDEADGSPTYIIDPMKGYVANLMSYRPGFVPGPLDQREWYFANLVIEQLIDFARLSLYGLRPPSFLKKKQFLFIGQGKDGRLHMKERVSLEQVKEMMQRKQTLELDQALPTFYEKVKANCSVEFSLQYIQVPIRLVNGLRPFLPLSAVIIDAKTGKLIYHQLYEQHLDEGLVQDLLLQMVKELGYMPANILTDALTYLFLTPLIRKQDVLVSISKELPRTWAINNQVLKYLVKKAE